jgi:hypothetical protein
MTLKEMEILSPPLRLIDWIVCTGSKANDAKT